MPYSVHSFVKFKTADYADLPDEQIDSRRTQQDIIGIAMNVLNELKPRLDQKLYQRKQIQFCPIYMFSSFISVISA